MTVSPIRDEGGRVVGASSIARDITEQQQLREAAKLRRWADDLEQANRNLETFTYAVAHDLRAPLRALAGFSEVLLEDYGDVLDEDGRDYAERILVASARPEPYCRADPAGCSLDIKYRQYHSTEGMSPRMTRAQQTDRNRGLLLDAARRLFLERGYHGATLEQIADEAGFSKGVVYSQFDSKAELFLALAGQRIEERATLHAKLAAKIAGSGDFAALLDGLRQADNELPGWLLLVIEFRVHAARDPELTRRLAAGHARTVDGVADLLATVAKPGQTLPVPARQMAEAMLVLSSGAALEQVASPAGPGASSLAELVRQVLEGQMPASGAGAQRLGSGHDSHDDYQH